MDEIPEESWGGFRDTFRIGPVSLDEAREVVLYERKAIEALDRTATDHEEFDLFAFALEWGETEALGPELLRRFDGGGLRELMRNPHDFSPLGGLEIGVAGFAHMLSAIGCVTAASCRSHGGGRSWSECPVVFFAAPSAVVEPLAELVRARSCGFGKARGFLVVEGASVVDLNSLAELVFEERARFSQS